LIKKNVTIHSIRHSFATHLLENVTDLRYIQEILGHKSSKINEVYTYVSTRDIGRFTSPLDRLNLRQEKKGDKDMRKTIGSKNSAIGRYRLYHQNWTKGDIVVYEVVMRHVSLNEESQNIQILEGVPS
jgi:hypothetical protein